MALGTLRRDAAFSICCLGLLLLACGAGFASDESDEQIVKNYFPQKLVESSLADHARGGPPATQIYDFKRADLDRSGRLDYIVAVYTNTLDGAIRVIKTSASANTLVAEAIDPGIGGIESSLELNDLDRDGVPEIVATFLPHAAHSLVWIFKWANRSVQLLSPIEKDEDGVLYTLFVDPHFEDIDGDGLQEVIVRDKPDKWSAPSSAAIYKLSGGVYVLLKQCSYFAVMKRFRAAPEWVNGSFAAEPNAVCSLTIENGFPNGTNRVTSATVEVNGVVVAEPSDFSQTVDQIQRQVKAQEDNTIRAKLDGAPESRIVITVNCTMTAAAGKTGAGVKQ